MSVYKYSAEIIYSINSWRDRGVYSELQGKKCEGLSFLLERLHCRLDYTDQYTAPDILDVVALINQWGLTHLLCWYLAWSHAGEGREGIRALWIQPEQPPRQASSSLLLRLFALRNSGLWLVVSAACVFVARQPRLLFMRMRKRLIPHLNILFNYAMSVYISWNFDRPVPRDGRRFPLLTTRS